MKKQISDLIAVAFFGLSVSCQTATAPVENLTSNSASSSEIQKMMPPGFPSNSAVPINGQTPGIPANALEVKKGTTPTPGIPDEATLKKQLNQRITDINAVNNPSSSIPNTNINVSSPNLPAGKDPKPIKRRM